MSQGYLVGLLFSEISMKREEQNNRYEYAALNYLILSTTSVYYITQSSSQ